MVVGDNPEFCVVVLILFLSHIRTENIDFFWVGFKRFLIQRYRLKSTDMSNLRNYELSWLFAKSLENLIKEALLV